MNDTTEPRYVVEQLGYRDYGVWDNDNEKWAFEGSQEACEERADQLNEADGCADCGKPNDGSWPYGSDVCTPCWDQAEAAEAEGEECS